MPRFVFVDFPLGNPCGKPWDVAMQYDIVGGALDLLERAWLPRTTGAAAGDLGARRADERWRERYMWVGDDNRAALAQGRRSAATGPGRQRAGEQRLARSRDGGKEITTMTEIPDVYLDLLREKKAFAHLAT